MAVSCFHLLWIGVSLSLPFPNLASFLPSGVSQTVHPHLPLHLSLVFSPPQSASHYLIDNSSPLAQPQFNSSEFHSGTVVHDAIKHGDDDGDEEYGEGSVPLTSQNFERVLHMYPIVAVHFFAPWCCPSNRFKPSWEKAAKIIRERYDPEMDGRIIIGKVDCTLEAKLCRRNRVPGYPCVGIFRNEINLREELGRRKHESFCGYRDVDKLVKTMEALVASIPVESYKHATGKRAETVKRPSLNYVKQLIPYISR